MSRSAAVIILAFSLLIDSETDWAAFRHGPGDAAYTSVVQFEGDPAEERSNRVLRVSFIEAATVFNDPLQWTIEDPDHSTVEARYLTTGFLVASDC